MTPPHWHINLQLLFKAGFLAIMTVGEPGAQGAGVTGTQGMGVSTPRAAVVALATVGLDNEVHIPKGMIFFIGTLSMMVAAGRLLTLTIFSGVTTSVEGATPNEHCKFADRITC